jgi:hypothetical protein
VCEQFVSFLVATRQMSGVPVTNLSQKIHKLVR